jgi:hypothetical protein
MSTNPSKPRDRKAYYRRWYLKHAASERAKANERKHERNQSMTEDQRKAWLESRKKEGKITRLRRDVLRACDAEFDQAYRLKRAEQKKAYREKLKSEPDRLEKYREAKKLAQQRRRAGIKGAASKIVTICKIKKAMPAQKTSLPVCPKFSVAQKYAQIMTGLAFANESFVSGEPK